VAALLGIILTIAAGTSVRTLYGAGGSGVSVNPNNTTQVYYQATPFVVQVALSNLSGPGLTPVSGYQYGLSWDPTVLKWLSGPDVGAGTVTPAPVLPCAEQVITWGTATATPTNFVPTSTPTSTNTPLTTTPTNTPTATFTPSQTPTPGGYVQVACATISTVTPVPNGVVGTFRFQPLVTAPASSPLKLLNVKLVDFFGNPVTPAPGLSSGVANFQPCYDVNGDHSVDIVDLSLVAGAFLTIRGQPGYVAAYDVNNDGSIDIVDLSLIASEFLFRC
jgi:hypothetical protein